jgi:hypothetical protein
MPLASQSFLVVMPQLWARLVDGDTLRSGLVHPTAMEAKKQSERRDVA